MSRSGQIEMVFWDEPFDQIRDTVGTQRAESGGILLGSREDYVVKKFVFDPHGSRFSAGYDPDVSFVNKVIKREWQQNQLALLGFVHSHPRGVRRLSGDWGNGFGDIGYMRRIFAAIPALNKFLVPIVYSCNDGGPFEIFPYIAERNDIENYREATLVVQGRSEPTASSSLEPTQECDTQYEPDTVETYRTLDGEAHFTFSFVDAGDHYEADIVDMPPYGDRSDRLHRTHRARSPRGGYQADLRGLESKANLNVARALAGLWAELTWQYIKHDERF